ncbi:MAG: 4-hydroxy-3-methylbut-2-enyl diphosphate reductase [Planctomycetes bacterium]|nr:4-hydroxy-3-methylbut-2-enyl diphosphate reductase [Planctomycetota bacterium]
MVDEITDEQLEDHTPPAMHAAVIATTRTGATIEVAASAGYCWGVERAIDLAVDAARDKSRPTVTLGELIHNKLTVDRLQKDHDIQVVNSAEEAPAGAALVVRAHGVPPSVREIAKNRNLELIDGTCPLVDIIHRRARELKSEGWTVIIIGQRTHPEVIGILGSIGGDGFVVETVEDVETLPALKRVGIVLQSTLIAEKAAKILAALTPRCRQLKFFNTICHVTTERQTEARDLSHRADVILIVGSPHSSNTLKLEQVCRMQGCDTHRIDTIADIEPGWFAGKRHIGIHGGASTPRETLEGIVNYLVENLNEVSPVR